MQPNNSTVSEPVREDVPFPAATTCFLIRSALDVSACAETIRQATARGFQATDADYPASYRDNDRLVWDDPTLAAALFERVRSLLPERIVDGQAAYRLAGLNERFRFCRYRGGQSFRIHQDGAHDGGEGGRSRLTLQVYLDDGSGFEGGRTRFYASRKGPLLGAVRPATGTAIVFDHGFWHDGEPVVSGTKHVMRTDVMYLAEEDGRELEAGTRSPDGEGGEVLSGHLGYVWTVVALADGSLATGSRDRTIRLWRRDGPAWRSSGVYPGHEGSIHTLLEARPGVLLSGSRDHTLRLWDLATSTAEVVGRLTSAILCSTKIEPDLMGVGCGEGAIQLMTTAGEPRGTLVGHSGWVWSLAPVAPGRLVSASEDGSLRLWDVPSRSCLGLSTPGHGPGHAVTRVGEGMVAAGFADGTVGLYAVDRDQPSLECVRVFPCSRGELYTLCSLPGGLLATGGEDGYARVFRLHDGACLAERRHGGFVRTVTALNGGLVASAGYDGLVRLWRAS